VSADTASLDTACVPGDEVPYDGIDQDCDGHDLVDVDEDGWDAARAGGQDCDDADPGVNPDAAEVCGNLVDDDCDGLTDQACTSDASGPPDPGGLYWICGVVDAAPAVWITVVGLGLVAWRRVRR
jgi:hypothetical protein